MFLDARGGGSPLILSSLAHVWFFGLWEGGAKVPRGRNAREIFLLQLFSGINLY